MIDVERLLAIARDDGGSPILYHLSKSLADETRIDALVEKAEREPKSHRSVSLLRCNP